MIKNYMTYTALGFLAFTTISHASVLNVINENKKTIKVKIEAEGDSSATSKREISAERQSSFSITPSELNGKTYFSIKGDTNPFTPGGKCDHLNVEKNYQITFQDDKVGTTCVAEEIKVK